MKTKNTITVKKSKLFINQPNKTLPQINNVNDNVASFMKEREKERAQVEAKALKKAEDEANTCNYWKISELSEVSTNYTTDCGYYFSKWHKDINKPNVNILWRCPHCGKKSKLTWKSLL